MNEQPQLSPQPRKKNILGIAALVVAVLAFLGVSQLGARVQELSDKLDKQTSSTAKQPPATVGSTAVESGKKGFSMTVPDGWGPLVVDTNSDFVVMSGMSQPTVAAGAVTKVGAVKGYGSDGAILFMATLTSDKSAWPAQGDAATFTIGKGDDALVGKKYSYIYPSDQLAGIGYLRSQNDRDYEYVFTTKDGKRLIVTYSVYGRDPRNQVEAVDTIVQSIVVKQ